LEEDPEMYPMAGLEPCACASPCVTSDRQGRIETTIMQAMSSVPTVNESPIRDHVSSVPTVQWLAWSLVPVPYPCVTSDRQGRIETTIMQAMSSVPTVNESPIRDHVSSVPTVNGATLNFKIVLLNDYNSGNTTFC
jgi:hypothetical protein